MKKIGKFNLLDESICRLECNCGWSLQIAGKDEKDLTIIKKFLRTYENNKRKKKNKR